MLKQLWPIVEAGVIPAGVTLAALVLAGRLWRRDVAAPAWALPLAVTLGFVAGVAAMLRGSVWWPAPNLRMAHYALAGLCGVGLVALLPRAGGWGWAGLRWAVRAAIVGAVGWMLLEPRIRLAWSAEASVAAVAGLALAGAVWWWSLESAVRRHPGPGVLAATAAVAAGSAGVLILSGNAQYGEQAVILGVALGACAVLAAWRPPVAPGPGVGGVAAVVLAALWGGALAYDEAQIPVVAAVLVGLAPLAVWLGALGWVSGGPRWRAGVVQGVAGGLLVAAGAGAMALGLGGATPEEEPDGGSAAEYYYSSPAEDGGDAE